MASNTASRKDRHRNGKLMENVKVPCPICGHRCKSKRMDVHIRGHHPSYASNAN